MTHSPSITSLDLDIPIGIGSASMRGELRKPPHPRGVQVLLHGAGFTRKYWSMTPADQYSYTNRAWRANWATLNMDRPGHGSSTRLCSEQPTAPVVVDALVTLLRDLKRGKYGPFDQIVLVGHSAGTALALYACQRHPEIAADLSGIVLTGMVHAPDLADVAVPPDAVHAANREARFADLDDGWITTVPGRREDLWWSPASPADLLRQDENTKGIWSRTELADAREMWTTPITVSVPPILVIAGQQDNSFCPASAQAGRCRDNQALSEHEARFFQRGTRLTTHLVPGWGHVLSPSDEASRHILAWLARLQPGPGADHRAVVAR
ncbi:alpha/beta hydrolase [Amycolatopsis rubida]|uniref:Alpha/beta hydrolase n=1 Tax=Amycolatopsis rubida TaxID=112413 RepID=A0ABX0BSA5_9PSEU|nr:alpha/beta fold hydrolase [Amycolatopsis rubida]NEC55708.1 alpha/beta hydrolase [Amycolatopsis rubida]